MVNWGPICFIWWGDIFLENTPPGWFSREMHAIPVVKSMEKEQLSDIEAFLREEAPKLARFSDKDCRSNKSMRTISNDI